MAISRAKNRKRHRTDQAVTLAKSLAPEEIRAGDYVTLLHVVCEMPALVWCDDIALTGRDEIVRLQLVPENGGEPLKVKSVCLPFVLVKDASGKKRPLDIRRQRLAKLDPAYARAAWEKRKSKKKRTKRKNNR
jgi:hypothetical protein